MYIPTNIQTTDLESVVTQLYYNCLCEFSKVCFNSLAFSQPVNVNTYSFK